MASRISLRHILVGSTASMLLSLFCTPVYSQESFVYIAPSDHDRAAASQAQNVWRHARRANTEAGKAARSTDLSDKPSAASAAAADPPDSGGPRYPADLEYHGGAVVTSMTSHLIYVNLASSMSCSTIATCWGDPYQMLHDLGRSTMIHIVDQYTGRSDNNRYTASHTGLMVNYPLSAKPYTDADMLAIVHSVVTARDLRTGYDNEYHVFLVPGQDECFDTTYAVCYSPDKPSTWFFCAYHGSADFPDIGHVLYSVEPYVDVNPGCGSRPNGPNGQLADSTNNVLSHETFETITDPDGTAWTNTLDNGLFGQEIGDECSFLIFPTATTVFFDPSNVTLNGRNYIIQPEYDNAQHACTTSP
jgi:hypothetical protein